MHAKFQRNRLSNYEVIVIVRKATFLHFCTWHVHQESPTCIGIVQYLEEGMKLLYKKTASESVKWLLRYGLSKTFQVGSGRAGRNFPNSELIWALRR